MVGRLRGGKDGRVPTDELQELPIIRQNAGRQVQQAHGECPYRPRATRQCVYIEQSLDNNIVTWLGVT